MKTNDMSGGKDAPEQATRQRITLDGVAYTATIQQDGVWWIGWIEEVSGVNCQESSRGRLLESLSAALREILECDRREAV